MIIEKLTPTKFKDILSTLPDINTLSDDQLKRLCEVKSKIEFQQQHFKIIYLVPEPYQEGFFASKKLIRVIAGGNQSGKTLCGFTEGLKIAFGIDHNHKIPVPNKGRIGTTDLQKGIGEDIQMHFDRWVPKSELKDKPKRYPGGELKKITFKNGSTIDFLSYEQDDMIWEGWQGHWVFLNEPAPREKYIASRRGLLKNKGYLWIAATLLKQPWITEELLSKSGTEEVDCWYWNTEDNTYLDTEAIKAWAKDLSPEEKETRLHGIPRQLFGRIYKEFNPDIHVVNDFEIPKEWTRYFALDYHPKINIAGLWLAVAPDGRMYCYDELWVGGTIKEIADKIKDKDGQDIIRRRWIEWLAAVNERSGSTITNPKKEFIKYGLTKITNVIKEFNTGINFVHQALQKDREGIPTLRFFRTKCPMTIKSMGFYSWQEYGENDSNCQKAGKSFSHFPDDLRYLLAGRPKYINPEIENYVYDYQADEVTGYGH